ncbi:unnamed protein product [marine sediment metagenome]|uniref:Uncharacterized protein n=1 Tax=marine sediment metagenome TaxID=412755 RepID=X1Q224_9ZZZZ
MSEDKERAKDQAKAQLESAVVMVKRLKHCQDCNGEDCELPDAEILAGITISSEDGMRADEQDREEYHDEGTVCQLIQDDPLSVEVRSDWHTPGEANPPSEYFILLCSGGPAVRIIGELSEHQEPDTARLEYQDWFTPWVRYTNTSPEEDEALLTYARQFYFGA